jgi:hypothetical protein
MRRIAAPLLVLLALLLPTAVAAAAPVADFEQAVSAARFPAAGGSGANAAGAWRTTTPLRAPRRFELLGVRAGDADEVALRVRRPDGGWSRWATVHAGEPVWSGAARVYQLRVDGRSRAVRMHFVAVSGHRPSPSASAAAGLRPAIVPRSAWDSDHDCRPREIPVYGRVDFAMVHHTVSLNGYGRGDVPGMVLAICRFHRNGNRWNDLGYNLLVDRFGTVWEGRHGGVEQPVVGAQAQGWNSVSTGVAAIGDFGAGGLPDVALRSLARVLAWKLSLAGVPASGSIGEVSIGGDLNRWPEGAHVRFARIAAHRDGDETECPGLGLLTQFPELRAQTRRLLPAPRELLTISPAIAPQDAGGPVFLTGRLARAGGTRPAAETIALQRREAGAWVDVAAARTGADGIWNAALSLTENAQLRAVHTASGIASPAIATAVRAGIRVRADRAAVRLGGEVELTGTTSPPKARVRVVVERRVGERRFRRVRAQLVTTVTGGFARTLRLPAAGVYRIRATTAADAANAAGISRSLAVRVSARRP